MYSIINNISFISKIFEMKFINISFERGLGIIAPRFILNFKSEKEAMDIEVESNFRIRTKDSIILCFNDLYIDLKGNELSVRRFRSQKNIEKTYLSTKLKYINNNISPSMVTKLQYNLYGDLSIKLRNGLILEGFNDTHLNDAVLYRFIHKHENTKDIYEIKVLNGDLILERVGF